MPSRTASPFRQLTFTTVSETWGEEAHASLRSRTCPLCRGTRLLGPFDDFAISGEWLHCPDCRFSGDPVQWTAEVLSLSFRATLRVLDSSCSSLPQQIYDPQIFRGYLRNYCVQRRHFERLRRDALVDLPQYEPCSLTRMQSYVLRTFPRDRRAQYGFVGATTAAKIESAFHCRSYRPQARLNREGHRTLRRGSGPGRGRVFAGRDWDETIIIPFEDLPGRTAGLYLVRDVPAPAPEDRFFRAVPSELSYKGRREAGLSMLSPALTSPVSQVERRLFVIYDPEYAVQLQLRHLQTSTTLLPIVGAFADEQAESDDVFRLLRNRELIFWAPRPEMRRACLIQCCHVQGRYSDLSDPRLSRNGTPPSPYLLMSLSSTAEPWDAALRRELRRGTPDEAAALLRDLRLPGDRHNAILRDLGIGFVERIRASAIPASACRRVDMLSGVSVVERPEGWFDADTEQCLLNARIHFEEVRNFTSGRQEIEGQWELPSGNSARFVVAPTDLWGRGLLEAVLATLSENLRREIRSAPLIDSCLWRVATTLHAPSRRDQVDYVGWRSDNGLHFRHFTLRLGGHVEAALDPHIPESAPAADFQPPQDLRKEAVARFSRRSRDGRIFWAITACIAYNVLSRLLGYNPRGIGLAGKGAEAIGRMAAMALGCREFEFPRACTPKAFAATLEQGVGRHGWPFYVTTNGLHRPRDCRRRMAVSPAAAWCITPVSPDTEPYGDYRNWILIRSDRCEGDLDYLQHHAHRILPAYFRDLLARRGPRNPYGIHAYCSRDALYLQTLLQDLSRWFGLQRGDAELVLEADRLIEMDGRPLSRR